MSYTFLADREEAFSVEYFADIPASVLWRLKLTAGSVCSSDSETAYYRASRSGMTSKPLTGGRGADSSISSRVASPVKASALPATEPALTTKNRDSGENKPESLARFDRATCSLRTRQRSLFEEGYELLASLPRWGMVQSDGELYRLPTPSGLLELRAWITSASVSGSTESLPSPVAGDATGSRGSKGKDRPDEGGLLKMVKRMPSPDARDSHAEGVESGLRRLEKYFTMGLQTAVRVGTPMAANKVRSEEFKDGRNPNLLEFVRLPTPTKQDANGRDRHNQKDGSTTPSLLGIARVPTPKSEDGQCSGGHLDKDDTLYGLICRPKRLPSPLKRDAQSIKKGKRGANSPGGRTLGVEVERMPMPDSRCWKSGAGREDNGHSPQLEAVVQGQLNPDWVEWLQGWPVGWSSLEPMSRETFQAWLDAHEGRAPSWWAAEPPIPRIATKVPNRVKRLEAIGDSQVPACAAMAWGMMNSFARNAVERADRLT